MRRVDCPRCGVRVEALPWATGKHRLTDAYAWFLAGWAKRRAIRDGWRLFGAIERMESAMRRSVLVVPTFVVGAAVAAFGMLLLVQVGGPQHSTAELWTT